MIFKEQKLLHLRMVGHELEEISHSNVVCRIILVQAFGLNHDLFKTSVLTAHNFVE